MEIPVYLFTGFLEAGKTKFIQEALQGSDFNAGERTLLLLCEEGIEEYNPDKFFGKNVFIEVIEDEEDMSKELFVKLQQKYRAERVIVEYNGMWGLDSFYKAMPEEWLTYQEMLFFDGRTFLSYNKNMRQQVFDKLKSAELIVFNRCDRDAMDDVDENGISTKLAFHKICRVANRKNQIIYEYGPEDVELDQFIDPLPYDLEADSIEIKDEWFAEWYRDINEEQRKYDGKTLKLKGRVIKGGELPKDKFIFGRHLMTCCAEDIQFAGVVCKWKQAFEKLKNGQWAVITAKVKVERDPVYGGGPGPVFYCTEVRKAAPAVPEVAAF